MSQSIWPAAAKARRRKVLWFQVRRITPCADYSRVRWPWPSRRVATTGQAPAPPAVADLVQGLTRETVWTLVESVPMKFPTYHPQGMVKIGDTLFVSSVEVKVRTRTVSAADRRLRP